MSEGSKDTCEYLVHIRPSPYLVSVFLALLFTQEHRKSRLISVSSHVVKMALPASSCMEWAEWWGRYLNNLTSGKGRWPANSGITSMWTLWVARGATGIEITPELFPQTAQLLLLSTTARIKRKHYKDLLWKMENPQDSFRALWKSAF